ncbi:MAG: helix-turn-helix domain-containing protein [Terriglobia bacterium]
MKAKTYTTVEVAKMLGVAPRTIFRYLEARTIPEPEYVKLRGVKIRLWRAADIKRLRRYLDTQAQGTLKRVLRRWKAAKTSAPVSLAMQDTIPSKINVAVIPFPELRQPPIMPIAAGRLDLRMQFTPQDEVLTPEQLAKKLQVKKSWIYEMTRKRAGIRHTRPLPHVRIGKYIRFSWPDVVAWMNELEAAQTAKA